MSHTDDKWEILQRAKDAGWVDPGYTETLTQTVFRALEYLEQRQRIEEPDAQV